MSGKFPRVLEWSGVAPGVMRYFLHYYRCGGVDLRERESNNNDVWWRISVCIVCLSKGEAELSQLIISIKATVVSLVSIVHRISHKIRKIKLQLKIFHFWRQVGGGRWVRPCCQGSCQELQLIFLRLNPQEDDPSMLISKSFSTKCYKSCKSNFLEENCSHWNNLI